MVIYHFQRPPTITCIVCTRNSCITNINCKTFFENFRKCELRVTTMAKLSSCFLVHFNFCNKLHEIITSKWPIFALRILQWPKRNRTALTTCKPLAYIFLIGKIYFLLNNILFSFATEKHKNKANINLSNDNKKLVFW